MQDKPQIKTGMNRWLKLLIKIAITVVCLWYVSKKIDFKEAFDTIKHADAFYLVLALVAFVFSKLVSAIRLNIYFRNIDTRLSTQQNIRLYWLGMFYNLFLPGSIGGDAYKVFLLKRRFNGTYKKLSAAVLLDRFSGLLGLGLILAVYSFFVLDKDLYLIVIVAGSLLAVAGLYFIVKRWLRDFLPGFLSTLLLGIVVQALQVACTYLIMTALGIPAHMTEYIFIFLVSSAVSVLPFTIGGLGIREIVFIEGAKYFGLIREVSVAISLLFYLITLITSSVGALYIYKDPLQIKRDPKLSP